MTPHQVFIVAAIGGGAGVLVTALIVGLVIVAGDAVSGLVDALGDRRERVRKRRDLITCRAIDQLDTIDHPTDQ